jgi:hypothetical protein
MRAWLSLALLAVELAHAVYRPDYDVYHNVSGFERHLDAIAGDPALRDFVRVSTSSRLAVACTAALSAAPRPLAHTVHSNEHMSARGSPIPVLEITDFRHALAESGRPKLKVPPPAVAGPPGTVTGHHVPTTPPLSTVPCRCLPRSANTRASLWWWRRSSTSSTTW